MGGDLLEGAVLLDLHRRRVVRHPAQHLRERERERERERDERGEREREKKRERQE